MKTILPPPKIVILETATCPECAIIFAMPNTHLDALRATGKGFWCPNGHSLEFRKPAPEAARLRQELEEAQRKLTAAKSAELAERHRKEELAGEYAKLESKHANYKKRIQSGTCPHCRKQFAVLARHMRCAHGGEAAK